MYPNIDLSLRSTTEHVINCLEIPAFILGLRRKMTAINEQALTLLECDPQNGLAGILLSSIFPPATEAKICTWMDNLLESNRVWPKLSFKASIKGNLQSWSAVPLVDLEGNITGYMFQNLNSKLCHQKSVFPEIMHNPKDIEQIDVLIRRDLRWKTAVLSANQGVWDLDFEFDQHFLSETWRKMRGMSSTAAVPATTDGWLKMLHIDDLEEIKKQHAKIESGQSDVIDYTFRQRHNDGRWIWIMSCGNVVRRTAAGGIARMIGTDTDISDLKAIENERARLADSLGLAMDAGEMGQWELDPQSNSAIWDDRALEIFGLNDGCNRRPEVDWANMIHPDDREVTVAYNDNCIRDHKDIACDYRIITTEGNEKYIRSRAKYVPNTDGSSRYIGVNFDLTDDYVKTVALEKARERLEYESRHDALTSLANRRCLDEVFTQHTAEHTAGSIAAMHFDIDHFKQINDMYGHDAGDVTLKHIASTLKTYLPMDVLIARIGGDEFVAFFKKDPKIDEIISISQQIINSLDEPFFYNESRIRTGVSIGIALHDIKCEPKSSLFIEADIALYHAKKKGRATFQVYSDDMKTRMDQREEIQGDLINAIERNEITCYYQPQFDARTMKISGLEALVRWESSKHGLVTPDHFLQIAEDMGLIGKIDEIVLCCALRDLTYWAEAGISLPRISVNISAQRLTDPELSTRLGKLSIPRGMIVFELLESVFLDAENKVISANLRAIRSLGIDIEIDDFGTGHASILSLLRISPKRLKIDRELVQPIVESVKQRSLLEAMIRIGQTLNIQVVAEGVETDRHIEILRNLGCDYLQGFAMAKPMSSSEIRDFLTST